MNKKDIKDELNEMEKYKSEKNKKDEKKLYKINNLMLLNNSNRNGYAVQDVIVSKRKIENKKGKKITVYDFSLDGINIASTNEKGEIILTDEYKNMLKEQNKESYDLLQIEQREPRKISIEDLQNLKPIENENDIEITEHNKNINNKSIENEKDEEQDEKDQSKKNKKIDKEVTKEAIEEKFGDKYVVTTEITDNKIASKLAGTEGFIGRPIIAYNKQTKEFNLLGTKQNGELAEARVRRTGSIVNVTEYNQDGTTMKETTINGMMYITPNDAISIEMTSAGQVNLREVINPNDPDNKVVVPIDNTRSISPTSKEIDEMKKNGTGLDEVLDIINEMEKDYLISSDEANKLKSDIAHNTKSVDEDKDNLKKLKEQKIKEKENKKEKEASKEQEIDEDDGLPPMADPFNPNKLSRY